MKAFDILNHVGSAAATLYRTTAACSAKQKANTSVTSATTQRHSAASHAETAFSTTITAAMTISICANIVSIITTSVQNVAV